MNCRADCACFRHCHSPL